MNAAQLHLTLNHLPVLLSPIGGGLLAVGLYFRSGDLKKAGVFLMVLAGLAAIPVYLAGQSSESILKNYPGVSRVAMIQHAEAAWASLIAIEIAAVGALLTFILLFRTKFIARTLWTVLLILVVLACGLLVRTAHLGGLIRHEEIHTAEERERFDAGNAVNGN